MRIAQVMLGKGFGGAERSFVDTALSLSERGHSVLAVCHKKFSALNELKDVPALELFTVNALGQWDFLTPRRIAGALIQFRAEVVHTQLKRAAWHGGRAGRLAGIPVVSKLHNYVDLRRYRNVAHILGTTEDQRRHALEQGWPADRVSVVPNFSRISPVSEIRTARQPIRFLSYGRYVPKKGFDILLHAFAQLLSQGVNASLRIGGRGPELDKLRALSEELGIEDHVSLGEWFSDVVPALDASDCFVLPSFDEPFGIVMLEAMARGVPIISTRTAGPLSVLSEQSALFCDVRDIESLATQMRAHLEDEHSAKQRAEAALELYRDRYFVDSVIPLIESIYTKVIDNRK